MNISLNILKALADETRLRCVMLLEAEGELCVCEITYALVLSQPKVSRHLALLRDAGIVTDRREGLWVYYRIRPSLPHWARSVIREIAGATENRVPFVDDRRRLAIMADRPGNVCCT